MKILATVRQLNKYNDIDDMNKYINIISLSKFKNLNIEIGPFKYLLLNKNYLDEILKIKKFCKEKKLNILSTHAPYITNFYWNKVTKKEESELIDFVNKSLTITEKLGAQIMVLHIGTFIEDNTYNLEKSVLKNVEFLLKFTERAQKLNIKIAIENHTNFENGYYPTFSELLNIANIVNKKVGENVIAICFDTGHANLTKDDNLEEILKFGDLLKIIHIHDNNGINDEHNQILKGNINWEKVNKIFKKINYNSLIMSEVRYNKEDLLTFGNKPLNETYSLIKKIFN